MSNVIAFDPASRTGWAFYSPKFKAWRCGSFELGDKDTIDAIVGDVAIYHSCGFHCVCEDPQFSRGKSTKPIHFAMRDIEHAWGAVSNEPVEYIALSTWRAWHQIKATPGFSLKTQAVMRAIALGAELPKLNGKYDDNAAEAVCLCEYARRRNGEVE